MRKSIKEFKGLTENEVIKSQEKYGQNIISKRKGKNFLKQYLESFGDPIIKILLIALAVNTIFILKNFNWYESVGILIAIFLATFISTLSEYGSESAFEKLQEEAAKTKSRVIRYKGIREIATTDIVTGDLIELQAGDKIPADGELISGEITVDQSCLNGESKETTKYNLNIKKDLIHKENDFLNVNSLFSGSVVCTGEGIMKIKAVGDNTYYGKLAHDIQDETRESPLKVRLGELAKIISRFGYIGAVLVGIAYIFNILFIDCGFNFPLILAKLSNLPYMIENLMNAITLAVTIIVVAVPEGLPMMITVVLSSNMKRMLKDNVLVRKLVGIETSGSINILFTDKTGTLTTGKLKVNTFIDGTNRQYNNAEEIRKNRPLWNILHTSLVYNNSASLTLKHRKNTAIGGNATDRALLEYACVHKDDKRRIIKQNTIPFNSTNKYSAARIGGDLKLTLIKGAPEKILSECTRYYDEFGNIKYLDSLENINHTLNEMSNKAMRLIAVAATDEDLSDGKAFKNLMLVGVIGIRDEIRDRKSVV